MSLFQIEASPKITRILIDGDHFGQEYAIDFIELARTGIADGEYFFLTCGCGEPGCAGLFEPIKVTSDAEKIHWHVTKPEPERWFTFTKSNYKKELRKMIAGIFSLSQRAASHIGPYGFDRERLKGLADQLEERAAGA